ncbi:MAG: hypothetical protein FWH22_03185 [Fibromonadales bacterium]|nr:hypothetical protein [Fibromonadales bacterium]
MFRYAILIVFIALSFSQSFARRCGTVQFALNAENPEKRILAKPGFNNCTFADYYGTGEVLERRVLGEQNFIIYYKLEGVHAVKTERYIDSLAKYLTDAYKLHKHELGMKEIQSARQTFHYQKTVPLGFYPVEVIDTGLLRNGEGEYEGAFGLTLTPTKGSKATQIAIENDFFYGANCDGKLSTTPFPSIIHGDYSGDKWHLALKVTTFHELYHSFQLSQVDITNNNSFWLEASATGTEEIGAPEVDDYISYIYTKSLSPLGAFANLGQNMEQEDGYGHAVLYLFLHSELGSHFDSAIWDSFAKNPGNNFAMQLARVADALGKNPDTLFHKYATDIFYSGDRAEFSPYEYGVSSSLADMPKWPEWRINSNTQNNWNLPVGAINFILKTNEQHPKIDQAIKVSSLNYGDSSIWILSRLLEAEYIKPLPKGEFAAYPNPWNPRKTSDIKFKYLPENSKGIEIRSSNGSLLERIHSEAEKDPIWHPKRNPAPGILYYRSLPHGKTKVLIVEY